MRPAAACGAAEKLRPSGIWQDWIAVFGCFPAIPEWVCRFCFNSTKCLLFSALAASSLLYCRFSHATAVLNDQVVISHGFFYDVEAKASQWLSDSWTMSTHSPYTWHKLHSRCSTTPNLVLLCPPGKLRSCAVLLKTLLVLQMVSEQLLQLLRIPRKRFLQLHVAGMEPHQ